MSYNSNFFAYKLCGKLCIRKFRYMQPKIIKKIPFELYCTLFYIESMNTYTYNNFFFLTLAGIKKIKPRFSIKFLF